MSYEDEEMIEGMKVFPKDLGWSKKKIDNITIQALGYRVDDYT